MRRAVLVALLLIALAQLAPDPPPAQGQTIPVPPSRVFIPLAGRSGGQVVNTPTATRTASPTASATATRTATATATRTPTPSPTATTAPLSPPIAANVTVKFSGYNCGSPFFGVVQSSEWRKTLTDSGESYTATGMFAVVLVEVEDMESGACNDVIGTRDFPGADWSPVVLVGPNDTRHNFCSYGCLSLAAFIYQTRRILAYRWSGGEVGDVAFVYDVPNPYQNFALWAPSAW